MNSKNKQLTKSETLIAYLYAIVAIIQLHPYFLWGDILVFRMIALILIPLVTMLILKKSKVKISTYYIILIVTLIFLYLQVISINAKNFISISSILVLLFFILDNNIQKKAFRSFYNIFIFTLLPGLLLYILIFLGLDLPWTMLEPSHGLKALYGHFYRNYLVMVILSSQIFPTDLGEVFRFSAIYDEPGRVGTVAALLLVATRFNLNNWKAKVLLVSGMLSFSMAFFVMIFIYIVLTKPFRSFLISLPFIALFIYFSDDLQENLLLNHYVFERFELASEDLEAVDNRSSYIFDKAFQEFKQSSQLYIGMGNAAHEKLNAGVSIYKTLIYNFGIIGFFLIIVIYLSILVQKIILYKNIKKIMPFMLVFIASNYQRPDVFSLWMFIIYIGAIFVVTEDTYLCENKYV